MTRQQRFKRAIRLGTGEAYLLLKKHPTTDFSASILAATTRNMAYDPQCEGSRATYLLTLIKASHRKAAIVEAILEAFIQETDDDWGLMQMYEVVQQLAREGEQRARALLYERFERNALPGSEFCGQHSIIELDGMDGLLRVAEVRGKMLRNDPDDWEDSRVVDNFQEENPGVDVYAILQEAATHNPFIAACLAAIDQNRQRRSARGERAKITYQALQKKIQANSLKYVSSFVSKDLSQQDIEQLAEDFLRETNPTKQAQYLRLFNRIKFPFGYPPLLALAQQSSPSKVIEWAVGALAFFKGEDIRTLALEKLGRADDASFYAELLVENYQEGDGRLLAQVAERTRSPHRIHALVGSCRRIYAHHSVAECQRPLEILYDKTNCGLCRYDMVKLLRDNGVLSDRIKTELLLDCNKDTQKLLFEETTNK